MIYMILARAKDGTIGHEDKLPWSIKSDLKNFKKMTMGKNVLMGRKTYDSLPGKKLPGRNKFVLTRNESFNPDREDVHVYTDWRDILHLAEFTDFWIIGGAEIYRRFLPFTSYIYESYVDAEPDGDTKWSDHEGNEDWAVINSGEKDTWIQEEGDEYKYKLLHYSRVYHLTDEEVNVHIFRQD